MPSFRSALTLTALSLGLASTLSFAQALPVFPSMAQSYAQPVRNVAFTDPSSVRQDLARIDAAMNATHSFEGRFTQYGSDGTVSSGKVYLQRPGKLRFDYDPPNALLIVSDGVTLTQLDRKLETEDKVPLSATPLNYFLRSNVNLANDTEVIGLTKDASEMRVTARDGSGEIDGTITMVFDARTLALKAWIIGDSFGSETRVQLSNLSYNGQLDPRLFVLRDNSRRATRRGRLR